MTEPTTYYSSSAGQWRLIHQGMPACKDGTLREAETCAAAYKLTPAAEFWNGEKGEFQSFLLDTQQAAEAAAFTLTHTLNQPRTTSAQNPLF
jgi:hypothetical protein